MNNYFWGYLTLITATIVFIFSFVLLNRKKYFNSLFFILIGGILLRIYSSSDSFLHSWDEKYHALVAKNLLQTPLKPTLYKNPILPYHYYTWTSNHIWLHKPPFALWCIAGSYKFFGINVFTTRIPSIIFSSILIIITFFLGKLFFDEFVGIIAAFFCSINGKILDLCAGRASTDHVDLIFISLVSFAIYFIAQFGKNKKPISIIISSIFFGLALLTKSVPAMFISIVGFVVLLESGFKISKILAIVTMQFIIAVIIALPWHLYIFTHFNNEAWHENMLFINRYAKSLEQSNQPWWFFINEMRVAYHDLIYPCLMVFIYIVFKKKQYFGLLVWCVVPVVIFSIAANKMPAYIAISAIAFFIICAYMYKEVLRKFNAKWIQLLIVIGIIGMPVRYSLERLKPWNKPEEKKFCCRLQKIGKLDYSNAILFNYSNNIEGMFYTNFAAIYPHIPADTTLINLQKKGYRIMVNNNAEIPNFSYVKKYELMELE